MNRFSNRSPIPLHFPVYLLVYENGEPVTYDWQRKDGERSGKAAMVFSDEGGGGLLEEVTLEEMEEEEDDEVPTKLITYRCAGELLPVMELIETQGIEEVWFSILPGKSEAQESGEPPTHVRGLEPISDFLERLRKLKDQEEKMGMN